ncbi:MAG: hypothetical protein LBB78_11060, partial [Spirochaetaceae bacterium]|nr:hypothetical protein [Spirochaetaceae bacterium]
MYTKVYANNCGKTREKKQVEVMMKKILWIRGIMGMFLVMSLALMGCDNGTTSTNGESPYTPPPPSSPSGPPSGSSPERTQALPVGSFDVNTSSPLNPTGLTASAVQGIVSGNITVTLGSTGTGVEIGIPTAQQADFAPGGFDPVESARLDYIAFALQGLEGGITNTKIRQTNGAFKLYSGSSSYHEYVGSPPPAVLTPGEFYEDSNGNIVKEKLYVVSNGDFTVGTYRTTNG